MGYAAESSPLTGPLRRPDPARGDAGSCSPSRNWPPRRASCCYWASASVSDPALEPAVGELSTTVAENTTGPRYAQFVADLEGRLGAGRDVLDPGTVQVIEQSLATIDSAIVQARTALEADPNNVYLNQHLASARAKKLRLLEDATSLIAART